MANNRLWLVHRPTGKAVHFGKRMGWGWYGAPSAATIQALFDFVEIGQYDGSQDDFALLMEDPSDAPEIRIRQWSYGEVENGLRNINLHT